MISPSYDSSELVNLVQDAAELIRTKGEAAFDEFRIPDSRWRKDELYIFVIDPTGYAEVHPDPAMEGKNVAELKDVTGKPFIQGFINTTMEYPDKTEGWYHYQWPVPGGLLPRWKSSYLKRVTSPSGNTHIVAAGIYNDSMEKPFVVDMVNDAVKQIEKNGKSAFALFHDPSGPFIAKDAYIFVFDTQGFDLVNPAFPNLEGRKLIDLTDTQGKHLVHEMFEVVKTSGSGWVDYMWPKPGENVSTEKSAYVTKAVMGDEWVLVGCGVYLEDAPIAAPLTKQMRTSELMTLVRQGAALLEERGEMAYADFRVKGSKWFSDDTYFFVWALDGTRVFHAANPEGEGDNVRDIKDIIGRPFGKMMLSAAESPSGEGWVHYMYPEPGDIFPAWKSTFVKRVTFPSGQKYLVGCGIYNMQMDESFIEDLVNRAAALVEEKGKDAFPYLRDKTGPFVFMDTYVFVNNPEGIELVNPMFPNLEGQDLIDLKDLTGKSVIRDQVAAVENQDSAWVDLNWFKPGTNEPAFKRTFTRKVKSDGETYIVGAGIYLEN